MPYIGNNLATQFQAFATQTITGDGSTGYTLDKAVTNGKELLVYINNVKQEEGSGKSYTASGTTITFSAAVASTDSCYLVYMGSAQQTVVPPDASVSSSKLASGFPSASLDMNGTELILDADGDTSITADTDDRIDFKTAGSDIASFDASGNLSIGNGTATNDGAIHVNGGSSAKNIVIESDRDSDGQGLGNLQFHSAGTNVVQVSAERGSADNSGDLVLYAAISGSLGERFRISNITNTITNPVGSNNALIVHNTAGSSPYGLQIDNDVDINNGSNWFIHAIGNTTSRFKVFTNGNVVNTNNSYGSISDEKLKENIVDSGSQWNDIKALKVRKYSLKEDKLDAPNKIGVIAQELETANMNGLVLDTPDVDKDLKDLGTVTKTVNYSILYMKAVKALQEAMTRIEALEAEVAKLKG